MTCSASTDCTAVVIIGVAKKVIAVESLPFPLNPLISCISQRQEPLYSTTVAAFAVTALRGCPFNLHFMMIRLYSTYLIFKDLSAIALHYE